jgi:hypothetical protein
MCDFVSLCRAKGIWHSRKSSERSTHLGPATSALCSLTLACISRRTVKRHRSKSRASEWNLSVRFRNGDLG